MNCPVCNRILAPTLSICPSCGAMMNDSVREELKDKISAKPKPIKFEAKINPPVFEKPATPAIPKPAAAPAIPKPLPVEKLKTAEITAKTTSPILVEFQNKNATLPDWRLQLQNAVRKRIGQENGEICSVSVQTAPHRIQMRTSGANALQAAVYEETAPAQIANPTLESALRRIEASRRMYLVEENPEIPAPQIPVPVVKNYPFRIASRNTDFVPSRPEIKTSVNFSAKPKIAEPLKTEIEVLDTNKLPKLPQASIIAEHAAKLPVEETLEKTEIHDAPLIKITRVKFGDEEFTEFENEEIEEIVEIQEENEDLAPFAMRFNAGLFDLILGSFISLILLAPFMLSGGNWFSFAGFLAFLVTCSIVMFIYLTTALGLSGKTLGMKIFSLETIDVEENDYPTFHQAAVSSSLYLISLAFGGIGFLTVPFNPDKRAAHDLLSGTIVVKEY